MAAGSQMADLKIGVTYRLYLSQGGMVVTVMGLLETWWVSEWGTVKVEIGDASIVFEPELAVWSFAEVTD